jgi:hypothetical protein
MIQRLNLALLLFLPGVLIAQGNSAIAACEKIHNEKEKTLCIFNVFAQSDSLLALEFEAMRWFLSSTYQTDYNTSNPVKDSLILKSYEEKSKLIEKAFYEFKAFRDSMIEIYNTQYKDDPLRKFKTYKNVTELTIHQLEVFRKLKAEIVK